MEDDKNKSCKRTIKQVISHMSVTGQQVLEKESVEMKNIHTVCAHKRGL